MNILDKVFTADRQEVRIPLPINNLVQFGGEAFLSFEDAAKLRQWLDTVEHYADKQSSGKGLEFFSDAIYWNGEPLDIKGNGMRILREFQYVNTVSCLTLAERVWGDAMTPSDNIKKTVVVLNRKLLDKRVDVYIEKDGESFIIHKPK